MMEMLNTTQLKKLRYYLKEKPVTREFKSS